MIDMIYIYNSGPARSRQPPALDVSNSGRPYYGRRALVVASGTRFIKFGTRVFGLTLPEASPTRRPIRFGLTPNL